MTVQLPGRSPAITALFSMMMLFSAFGYLSATPQMLEGISHLGYPAYLLKILATAKILGVAAILYNKQQTLKEWAYAGFTINLLGASASHAFSGDEPAKIVTPLVMLGLFLVSYRIWRKSLARR